MGNIVTASQILTISFRSLGAALLAFVLIASTGCSDDIASVDSTDTPPEEVSVPFYDEDQIVGVDAKALQRALDEIESMADFSTMDTESKADNPVNIVDRSTLTCSDLADFQGLTGVVRNYDNIMRFGGLRIGQFFAGHSVASVDFAGFQHEFVFSTSGLDNPLTLEAGPSPSNLSTYRRPSGQRSIGGNGANGIFEPAIGAMAVQFDAPQSELGLKLVGTEAGGVALFRFYQSDGTLIYPLEVESENRTNTLTFARQGGVADIAGMIIFNLDPGGLRVDNIVYCDS